MMGSVLDRMAGLTAVVTGASSGIGLEFTRLLVRRGTRVVMVSNEAERLRTLAAELASLPGALAPLILPLDLTSSGATEVLEQFIDANSLQPRLLINNAGIFDFRSVANLSDRRIATYLDLHAGAVTRLTRSLALRMASLPPLPGGSVRGWILNMGSLACWTPMPGIALYSATKAYIRAFSRAFRIEMKPAGVSVTVACPGGIATGLFGLPPNLRRLGVRLGILATPEAFVRNALRHTLRGKAQYINGPLNRIAIVAVALLPERGRLIIKSRLLDRLDHRD